MSVPPGTEAREERPAHPMRASIILVSAVALLVVLLALASTLG